MSRFLITLVCMFQAHETTELMLRSGHRVWIYMFCLQWLRQMDFSWSPDQLTTNLILAHQRVDTSRWISYLNPQIKARYHSLSRRYPAVSIEQREIDNSQIHVQPQRLSTIWLVGTIMASLETLLIRILPNRYWRWRKRHGNAKKLVLSDGVLQLESWWIGGMKIVRLDGRVHATNLEKESEYARVMQMK